jgi:hypothetical protein
MDEQALLLKIVEQNNSILAQMRTFVTKEDFEDLETKVGVLNEFVNGNGKVGAKERLRLLEERIDQWKEYAQEVAEKVINKVALKVVGAFGVPLLLALIIWLFTTVYQASTGQGANPTPLP